MKYVLTKLLSLLLLLTLANHSSAAAVPQASVDRSVVSEGDSLTLTIRINDTGSLDAPDYSVLQRDFQVFGNSESSQHVLNNGHFESWTEWQTQLVPKRSGRLTIPAIAVAGAQTQPISIQVNAATQTATEDGSEPVFIETHLDRDSVYVQQQLLLTVRIFHAIQLDDMHFSEPSFDNASVRKVSESSFRRDINGVNYLVHELTYAIFPQQPGELTIPEMVFSATELTSRRSLFDFPGQGRAVRKMTKQINVHIKPIPKTFTGSVWLPTKNLTLAESWSGNPNKVAVGDSITRNVSIRADGLLAAQLPALELPKLDNAKLYADQPALDDQQDVSGVHGKRTENSALIPTKAGMLNLPETRVIWWDVDSDSEKIATLAPQTLTITAGTTTANNSPSNINTTAEPEPQTQTIEPASISNTITQSQDRWWQLATALLALAWSTTLYLYWRLRRSIPNTTANATPQNVAAPSEDAAFRALTDTCRANNPSATRKALLMWAQNFYRDSTLHTADQLLRISSDAALTRELQQLDNRLFGTQPYSGNWNGENLLSVVRALRKQRAEKPSAAQALPPLYPTA